MARKHDRRILQMRRYRERRQSGSDNDRPCRPDDIHPAVSTCSLPTTMGTVCGTPIPTGDANSEPMQTNVNDKCRRKRKASFGCRSQSNKKSASGKSPARRSLEPSLVRLDVGGTIKPLSRLSSPTKDMALRERNLGDDDDSESIFPLFHDDLSGAVVGSQESSRSTNEGSSLSQELGVNVMELQVHHRGRGHHGTMVQDHRNNVRSERIHEMQGCHTNDDSSLSQELGLDVRELLIKNRAVGRISANRSMGECHGDGKNERITHIERGHTDCDSSLSQELGVNVRELRVNHRERGSTDMNDFGSHDLGPSFDLVRANHLKGFDASDESQISEELGPNVAIVKIRQRNGNDVQNESSAVTIEQQRTTSEVFPCFGSENTVKLQCSRRPATVPLVEPPSDDLKKEFIDAYVRLTSKEELQLDYTCFSCSERLSENEASWMPVREMDSWINILTHPDGASLPNAAENNPHLTIPDGVTVDVRGFDVSRTEREITLCAECHSCICRKQLPPLSLANNNYIGEIPECLKGLTLPEEMLIAKMRVMISLIKLRQIAGPGTEQRALKGNSCVVEQDRATMISVLPWSAKSLPEVLQVVFVGSKKPSRNQLRQFLNVRRSRVAAAVDHLCKSEDEKSRDNINSLPEDDVPDELLSQIIFEDDKKVVDAALAENSDYAGRLNHDGSEAPTFHTSGLTNILPANISTDDLKGCNILKLLDQSSTPFVVYPTAGNAVNEYSNSDLWYGAFPSRFPLQKGAPEGVKRRVPLSLERWLTHSLNIRDNRFREHTVFMFYTFNLFMRRRVSLFTSLRLKRSSLEVQSSLSQLTTVDLTAISEALLAKKKLTDPRLLRILGMLRSVGGAVQGSPLAKKKQRSQLQSLNLYLGMPTFFVTLNPFEINSRLVLHYAGAINVIDLADLPNFRERAQIASRDPVACAKFFRVVIDAFHSEFLRCVKGYGGEVCSRPGILGTTTGYYGCFESQGRGTLHYHGLVYVKGLNAMSIARSIATDAEFKDRLKKYIDAIIVQGFVPSSVEVPEADATTADRLLSVPLSSSDPNFEQDFHYVTNHAAQLRQSHRCEATCFKYVSKKKQKTKDGGDCRFGYTVDGKELVNETTIDDNGNIVIKRTHPRMNGFNPEMMYVTRSNMDLKVITGDGASATVEYMTRYTTKAEASFQNMVSMVSAAKSTGDDKAFDGKTAKQIISRILNRLNSYQEYSAPFAALISLDLGDHVTSHTFEDLVFGPFLSMMKPDGHMTVGLRMDGEMVIEVNQAMDYTKRGANMKHVCLFEYVSQFKKVKLGTKETSDDVAKSRRGRKSLDRFTFDETHPQHETHVQRRRMHPVVPCLSQMPPLSTAQNEMFCMMTLLLFVPFLHPTDLKSTYSTWAEAFDATEFSPAMSEYYDNLVMIQEGRQLRNIGIAAAALKDNEDDRATCGGVEHRVECQTDDDMEEDILDMLHHTAPQQPTRINHYIEEAVQIVSNDREPSTDASVCQNVRVCPIIAASDVPYYAARLTEAITEHDDNIVQQCADNGSPVPIETSPFLASESYATVILKTAGDIARENELNRRQRMVFDLVVEKLILEATGSTDHERLYAFVSGEGGTGKTRIIKCIIELFRRLNLSHKIKTTATTGLAAQNVDGLTIHTCILFCPQADDIRSLNRESLECIWKEITFLIIDEVSMCSCVLLAQIHDAVALGTCGNPTPPFGGKINVITFGDFTQFPSVACPLYRPVTAMRRDQAEAIRGRLMWEQLNTCIILNEQMRQPDDKVFTDMLRRIQVGNGTENDRQLLLSRIPKNTCEFHRAPFADSKFIVARNDLRKVLNDRHATELSRRKKSKLWRVSAEDSYRVDVSDSVRRSVLSLPDSKTKNIPGTMLLTVDMPVMLTKNLAVPAGLCNGSTGFLVDVVLDNSDVDTSPDENGVTNLSKVPAAILVQFDGCPLDCHLQRPGLITVVPQRVGFPYKGVRSDGQSFKVGVRRRGFPLIGNHASTGHKVQGLTLDHGVVDLKPPTGGNLGSAYPYVSLSRFRTLDSLLVLRDFPLSVLQCPPDRHLMNEQNRLAGLFRATVQANSAKFKDWITVDELDNLEPVKEAAGSWSCKQPRLANRSVNKQRETGRNPPSTGVQLSGVDSQLNTEIRDVARNCGLNTSSIDSVFGNRGDMNVDDLTITYFQRLVHQKIGSACIAYEAGVGYYSTHEFPRCVEASNGSPCIHILPNGNFPTAVEPGDRGGPLFEANHWLCAEYKDNTVIIYDSLLGRNTLSGFVRYFIRDVFPPDSKIVLANVQQQRGVDCGPHAIINAILCAFDTDPQGVGFDNIVYNNSRLLPCNTVRRYVWDMLKSQNIIPIPNAFDRSFDPHVARNIYVRDI